MSTKVVTICGQLRHYSYHSISNFVTKRDVYSELFAVENKGIRKTSPFMAFIRGAFDFLNTFIVRCGFLDGYRGLLISVSNANVTFYKYLKLYEANINQNKKVLICLDRLKLLNCGLGQVAVNYGRELLNVKTNSFEFNFLLPARGFIEFEKKIAHTKLNLFRNLFSNYMKPYDLCHITHQLPSFSFGKGKKNILTIHDLNFIYTKSKQKKRKYTRSVQNNIYKSDAIVFISEFTKQIAYKYLNIPDSKIVRVIYNGVRPPGKNNEKPGWLPDKKFVFSIGQFLEKKNFHVLLPFIKHLPEDYILVIAGENNTRYGHKMEQIVVELKLANRIIFPGGISEEHKSFLYNNCMAFLFPSIAEGFGLPIIEAMLCSKPVFCSDRTSLREVGSEFAFFWQNFEPADMLEVYNKGLTKFLILNISLNSKLKIIN
jgi:glycosyltransferase involved in cell wall biosynthesis